MDQSESFGSFGSVRGEGAAKVMAPAIQPIEFQVSSTPGPFGTVHWVNIEVPNICIYIYIIYISYIYIYI